MARWGAAAFLWVASFHRALAEFQVVERPREPEPAPARASPWKAIGQAALFAVLGTAWFWVSVFTQQRTLVEDDLVAPFLRIALVLTFAAELMGSIAIALVVWAISHRSELAARILVGLLNAGTALHALSVATSAPIALGAAVLCGIGLWVLLRTRR